MARFELFVWDRTGKKVPAKVLRATREDLETTSYSTRMANRLDI